MRVQSYRDLRVWKTAVDLTLEVYRITESFPTSERFALTSQLRRASVSIASNIAEGHARSTRGEYRNFLSIARGSAIEVEVQLFLAERIGYVQAPMLITPHITDSQTLDYPCLHTGFVCEYELPRWDPIHGAAWNHPLWSEG